VVACKSKRLSRVSHRELLISWNSAPSFRSRPWRGARRGRSRCLGALPDRALSGASRRGKARQDFPTPLDEAAAVALMTRRRGPARACRPGTSRRRWRCA
jgi:hypothetical protein